MSAPKNLKYTEEHEWVRIEGDSVIVGITDFAQKQLGDIVYVEIETEGEALEKGEEFGTVEAVKTTSELFMPLTGTITEVNQQLLDSGLDKPELVNTDPYGEGWLVKITPTNIKDIEELMSAEEYSSLVENS